MVPTSTFPIGDLAKYAKIDVVKTENCVFSFLGFLVDISLHSCWNNS